jgi:hypothetical protein
MDYLGLVKHLTPSLMQFQYYNESEIVVKCIHRIVIPAQAGIQKNDI